MRLLGLSLAQLDAGKLDEAEKCIAEAIEIHKGTRNWQALARIAQVFVSKFDKQEELRKRFFDLVKSATLDALCFTREKPDMEAGDAKAVASLCFVLYKLERDSSCAVWALNQLPELDPGMVCKLALCAEESEAIPTDALNAVLSSTYPRWGRKAENKSIQFVLDASGSMAGSNLETCKDAIKSIVQKNTKTTDFVGFLAFAHYSKVIFPLMLKGDQEPMMIEKVSEVKTFGRTAFYDAVKEGVDFLKNMEGGADSTKWLVALTDGADTDSQKDGSRYGSDAGRLACEELRSSDINIAIITVGSLPHETIRVVNNYIEACQATGGLGLHIVAHDREAISKAFDNIAAMMEEGLDEKL